MLLRSISSAARAGAALLFCAAAATPASAQTLQLTDSSATVLRGGSHANANLSSDRVLATRASSSAEYERRVLLKFDTHNEIPAGSSIESARLTLTVAGGNDDDRTVAAYRVSQSYDESSATWYRRKSSSSWSKPGGDIAERYATATVTDNVGSRVEFDVTELVRSVVAGKFDASSRYTRIMLIDAGSSSRDSYKEYFSDEAADAGVRPVLTVTLGAGTSEPPPPAPSTGSSLKVLHWNIKHGDNLTLITSWIAKWRPDVISLNEVEKFTGWGDEDQPGRLRDMLKAATGQTWYVHFAQRYGSWSSSGQGNLLLSRYPFASTGRETISYGRSLAIATVVVNGRNVTVMSAHLDAESASKRETQVKEILSIASGWSDPIIVAGDFNAWPDHTSIEIMDSKFHDSWAIADSEGTASSFSGNSPFGATKNGRIDYIWHSHGSSALKVKSSQVPDTRNSSGTMPSDHRPVLTVYEVR